MPPQAPPPVRAGFKALESLLPSVGAQVAEGLFHQVPRPPELAKRRRTMEPGEAFEVDLHGRRIRGEMWGSGPHVHLVHGWGGWHQQLGSHVTPLVEAGYTVLAHDALSHGESDHGDLGAHRTSVPELALSFAAVAKAHGPVAGVVAHSAGAMAALLAVRDGLQVGRMVGIATAVRADAMLNGMQDSLGFGDRISERLVKRVEDRHQVSFGDFDLIDLAPRLDPRPPLLLVHDVDDQEMPVADAVELADAWPNAQRLITTSGLGHYKIIWAPETVAATSDFLARD
ncbi:alpha/beta fold hydrolase [Propionibacteriaceae bacterium Y1685]|uniref:alpha/beta fold hydrolase n=1 Tax=Microlunatus sp. Y1700 TaxID=3418487 RepID=UPI003B7B4435